MDVCGGGFGLNTVLVWSFYPSQKAGAIGNLLLTMKGVLYSKVPARRPKKTGVSFVEQDIVKSWSFSSHDIVPATQDSRVTYQL